MVFVRSRSVWSLGLAVMLGLVWVSGAGADGKAPELRFHENGRFRIVQFTDIHWHDGSPEDMRSAALMGAVLDEEKPDLVVLTGDIIGGSKCKQPLTSFPNCVAPIVERKIPWAYTFGNHDDECRLTRDEIIEMVMRQPYSVAERGPHDIQGASNYVLPIRASKGRKQAAAIYCLDSNSYSAFNKDEYDWIRPNQIQWYRETAKRLRKKNGGDALPALAFFHIPLPEYVDVWNAGTCVGAKYEEPCCPKMNSGFFAAMVEAGDVMGTFVGHDHVNDYEGDWYGIRLCYGRSGGYTAYGREGFPRGARVIEMIEGERKFDTWLRLETSEKVVLTKAETDLPKK